MSNGLKVALAAAVLVVVAVVGGGAYWFLRDDAPPEVSLSAATDAVTGTTAAASGAGSTGSAPSTGSDGIAGTWVVDAESGEFGYESATGSFAGFRIQEELARIGTTTAVGRTGDIEGSVQIDGTTVSAVDVEIDMTTITTNESQRDGAVQRALETSQHPTATFTLTQPIDLGDGAAAGQAVAVDAVGDLSVHGVTRSVTFPLEAQLVGDQIVVVGALDVTFSDYDVEVPSAQIVVSVEDHGTLELQLLLVRG
jgi:polyisoprenoid-binding protein YceI